MLSAALFLYRQSLKPDNQELLLCPPEGLISGSPASLRVFVRTHAGFKPIEGAWVDLELENPADRKKYALFSRLTDKAGSLDGSFRVPDLPKGTYRLTVLARSKEGRDRYSFDVVLRRAYRILLSSDKPVYRPGEFIRLRSLVLEAGSGRAPKSGNICFQGLDPQGKTLFLNEVPLSPLGVASYDFELPEAMPQGKCQIRCRIGKDEVSTTVECLRSGSRFTSPVPGAEDFNRLMAMAQAGANLSINEREPRFIAGGSEIKLALTTDKILYRLGETMKVTILSAALDEPIFLDVLRDGQTVLTKSFFQSRSLTKAEIPLSDNLWGTLSLHAYRVGQWRLKAEATRTVIVSRPPDLLISIKLAKDNYRVGEQAGADFQVQDSKGRVVQAALRVQVVEEKGGISSEKSDEYKKDLFALTPWLLKDAAARRGSGGNLTPAHGEYFTKLMNYLYWKKICDLKDLRRKVLELAWFFFFIPLFILLSWLTFRYLKSVWDSWHLSIVFFIAFLLFFSASWDEYIAIGMAIGMLSIYVLVASGYAIIVISRNLLMSLLGRWNLIGIYLLSGILDFCSYRRYLVANEYEYFDLTYEIMLMTLLLGFLLIIAAALWALDDRKRRIGGKISSVLTWVAALLFLILSCNTYSLNLDIFHVFLSYMFPLCLVALVVLILLHKSSQPMGKLHPSIFLIAIALLGIAIISPNFRRGCGGVLTACESNLKNMGTALEMYSTDNRGLYPESLNKLVPDYLKKIPECPKAGSDTYSSSYECSRQPDDFTIFCSGDFHMEMGIVPNYPMYTASKGLVLENINSVQKGAGLSPEVVASTLVLPEMANETRSIQPSPYIMHPHIFTDETGCAGVDIPIPASRNSLKIFVIATTKDGKFGTASLHLPVGESLFPERREPKDPVQI
ncbi:MAG: MG2 domain-containing protein [bacterium]